MVALVSPGRLKLLSALLSGVGVLDPGPNCVRYAASPVRRVCPDAVVFEQLTEIDLALRGSRVVDEVRAREHPVEQFEIGTLLVNEESHDEAQDVRQYLHALIAGELYGRDDCADSLRQALSHLLLVHQLQQAAFLFDTDGLRAK